MYFHIIIAVLDFLAIVPFAILGHFIRSTNFIIIPIIAILVLLGFFHIIIAYEYNSYWDAVNISFKKFKDYNFLNPEKYEFKIIYVKYTPRYINNTTNLYENNLAIFFTTIFEYIKYWIFMFYNASNESSSLWNKSMRKYCSYIERDAETLKKKLQKDIDKSNAELEKIKKMIEDNKNKGIELKL